MPFPSRDEPLRDPNLPGKTFHYEGDDLIVSYPAPPPGTPETDPGATPEPVEQLIEQPVESSSVPPSGAETQENMADDAPTDEVPASGQSATESGDAAGESGHE